MQGIFNRSELLLGRAAMEAMAEKRVIVVGVGGVGSWCAESLVRTGVQHLTIVDSDRVSVTNINRQLMATTKTVGQMKVEVLRDRLLDINPDADIQTITSVYSRETSQEFHLEQYDYIIDCIDSLRDKIDLLVEATSLPRAKVYSSMGAALKLDPTRIATAEFWKVKGCPLGAAMRNRMRHNKLTLRKKVMCVYSEERLENKGADTVDMADDKLLFNKVAANGSLSHVTAIYGFTLAGMVIKHICDNAEG